MFHRTHGTGVKRALCATRHTLQQSLEVDVAATMLIPTPLSRRCWLTRLVLVLVAAVAAAAVVMQSVLD